MRAKIKNGWEGSGKTGFELFRCERPKHKVEQDWSVVVWDGDVEPSLHKTAGLTFLI